MNGSECNYLFGLMFTPIHEYIFILLNVGITFAFDLHLAKIIL